MGRPSNNCKLSDLHGCSLQAGHAGRRTLSAVRSLQSRAPNRWRRKWSYGGPVMPRRKITAGERSLLRRVFEETLPYAKLDVATNDHNIGGKTNSITPEDVPYLSTEIRCEDFDGPSVLKSYQGTFIHEFVHVWQHYHGVHKLLGAAWQYVRHGGDYDEAYWYDLADSNDLTDYNLEQQAAIIEDFWRINNGLATLRNK